MLGRRSGPRRPDSSSALRLPLLCAASKRRQAAASAAKPVVAPPFITKHVIKLLSTSSNTVSLASASCLPSAARILSNLHAGCRKKKAKNEQKTNADVVDTFQSHRRLLLRKEAPGGPEGGHESSFASSAILPVNSPLIGSGAVNSKRS